MGSFYTNITLRNVAMETVIAEMRELNRESYVYGGGGVSIVYDRETEKQDTSILPALALATTLATKWSWFRLWYILHRPFIAQISRHMALNMVFGFPEACILGYEYLHRGERTGDMAKGQLVHVERQGAR